jgi:hypothetical protein
MPHSRIAVPLRPALLASQLAFLLIALYQPLNLKAQQPEENPAVSDVNRDELIEQTAKLLREIYVFPDVAEKMATSIEQKNFEGGYDSINDLAGLTQQMTLDLQAISHDKHLGMMPEPSALPSGATQPGGNQPGGDLAAARAGNFGFRELEILPGNIGYLDLRGFIPAELGGPTAIAAMNFLANTSAIIFDLRSNGGGDPSMIQLISSYLFDKRQHLNSFYIRRGDRTEEFWTQETVSGPKMVDTPVYILTSSFTFSAAEEFTYNLKNMQRATVVGETTGGGAHPVDMHYLDLGDGLRAHLALPFGRAINPITGTNWEGTGVAPDIAAPADQALEVAQLEILKSLSAASESGSEKFALDWAREELEFKLQPDTIVVQSTSEFAGEYGARKITVEDGRLYYQRGNGPRLELKAMPTADRFHVGDFDDFRLQFVRDASGSIIGLKGLYGDGRVDENQRTGG